MATVEIEMSDIASVNDSEKKPEEEKVTPASFSDLFAFASVEDKVLFALGCFGSSCAAAVLPAINIVFGEIIDAIAQPDNVEELVNNAVIGMLVLAGVGFVSFFIAYFCTAMAGSRIANKFRVAYLEAVLSQDMTYFDQAEPGSIAVTLGDAAIDIQEGLSDKFAAAVQGVMQLVFGFAVAFYFGPELSLVLCACVPLLIGVTYLLTTYGSEDGIFGKEAYNAAANVASETISNIKTIVSLNAETSASKKYDDNLKVAEKAAIKQGTGAGFITGLLFFVMFAMYGVGFWFGGKMIADSTDDAMAEHPPPQELLDLISGDLTGTAAEDSEYYDNYLVITAACEGYSGESLETCACGIPWSTMENYADPNCGCGYSAGTFSTESICFTGGKTILVFFSILVGGFGLGTAGPGAQELAKARVAAAKMLQVIKRKPAVDINSKGKKITADEIQGDITLANVHFGYAKKSDESTRKVFNGVNLHIKAGQTVALVGESGCGKSTIAKLVQRFYDPTDGSILLDGADIKSLDLTSLRANIGVVSQEPLLFNTSILENIRYGKPSATDSEVEEAAKKANAHDFISTFPDKYQTSVGPKGSKLSGGQKQRVAIARAILRNPKVLILDEATSALDNESEKIVQKALDDVLATSKRTTIVIAHRLTTIRNADKIVVLGNPEGTSTVNGSQVMEQGTHDELMKANGLYKALVGTHADTKADVERMRSKSLEAEEDEVRKSMAKSIGSDDDEEVEEAEKSKSCMEMCGMGGEKEKKEGEESEEDKYVVDKNRIWNYSKSEYGWIALGSLGSICKGTVLPLVSLVFAEMINCWYKFDMDEVRSDSLNWSFLFYGLAAVNLFTETLQKGVFEMVGERLTRRLRSDLFRGIMRQDITWFEDEKNSQGILMSRLSTDVKYVRYVTGQSVGSTLEMFAAMTTAIAISLTASWEIFLIMIAMVPLLSLTEVFQWMAIKGAGGVIKKEMEQSQAKLSETVNGIREVQAFALEKDVANSIGQSIKVTVTKASEKQAVVKGIMMGMIQLIQFSVYAFAFWCGGQLIVKGQISFEDFNKSLWAMAFGASGLGQAAMFAGDAAKASNAVKSIFTVLDRAPPIDSEPWRNGGLADNDGMPIIRELATKAPDAVEELKGEITLKKVNFAYPTRKAAKVFSDMDLVIPAGKTVALVGSSGSGKSTVIQLLERYYDPISYSEQVDEKGEKSILQDTAEGAAGDIELDGANNKTLDVRWVRNNIGLVGQEPVLFNDTIFNNIALGKVGATRAEVEAAARSSNAHDFISALPDGYETNVGNAGGKVSGGQKQRIAIARALISQPKILLLDEATSALDNKSEKIVQETLDDLLTGEQKAARTTIIIAHRLTTIQNADIICVLDNDGFGSKVVEQGTHTELLKKKGKYAALVEAYQKKGD